MLTHEEKRVVLYAKNGKPTVSSEVTHKTPLESLNLNWRESDLREKERTKHVHRLHPYLGKYIPQLVEIFLRKFFSPGQTVLDPFAGSCTTLVQANELGINSIGYDISAFNILLGRAKTTKYNLDKVQNEVLDILAKVQTATQTNHAQKTLFDAETTTETTYFDENNEYLKTWFAPQSLQELLTYRHFIEIGHYKYTDLMKVILSRSARSARLTTHFDLDFPKRPQTTSYWCYKHSRECTPVTEAYKFLRRYSIDSLKRIKEFSLLRTDAQTELYHADSRKADIPSIDGVITSPPYVGLIDYHKQHAYSYHLLGLEDNRHDEIGPAANGSSKKTKQEYQQDIAQVLSRALASMPPGGFMIVVAGDRSNLYDEIARLIDVEVEAIVQRHVNRRTGRRASEFHESVFIWRKK